MSRDTDWHVFDKACEITAMAARGTADEVSAAPLADIPGKGLRAVHRLNIDATWEVTLRVAHRWMIPQRAGFIAFLGFSPRPAIPSMVHSSMARSALESLAAGIAQEWSTYGIRAVCVAAAAAG